MRTSRTTEHLVLIAVAGITAISAAPAWSEENETPFDVADLFFELNNTDGDLGIHAKIDGDDWKNLWIKDPGDRIILSVSAQGRMRQQGLTEISFESAEPPFDELAPADFLKRFPEGTYDIEATTLDGEELESEVAITHVLPGPPKFKFPPLASCDDPVTVTAPVTVSWNKVTKSHPTIGKPNRPIEVERYEVQLERLDSDLTASYELPSNVTSLPVPWAFTSKPGVVKVEVLVKAEDGNRTAEETCFRIP